MLQKVEMYTVVCDNCGEDVGVDSEYSCWADSSAAEDEASESDWLKVDKKHYCPKCFSYDANGKLRITKLSVRGNTLVDQTEQGEGVEAETQK